MVTILLEKILSVLEGWSASFASFIIDLMLKLNLIETETANLPDIKTNTDNISSNTDSMTATLTNIKTDTGSISGKVNSIDSNTTIIKNNINTISTNVGTASAFCEDTANNTLEIVDKITTIASDTTQLRTNSNSISSDVSEIKNTLGLYLYNTIVTEDSEGSICNFDTDLKDYLQEAKVTIPADANGISDCKIGYVDMNQYIQVFTGIHQGLTPSLDSDNNIVINGTSTSTYSNIAQNINCISGHVYYISLDIIENPNNISLRAGLLNVTGATTDINTTGKNIKIIKSTTTTNGGSGITGFLANTDMTGIKLKMIVIDLTKAFNASIAEVLLNSPDYVTSIFPKSYYPYNAGGTLVTLESVNGSYYPNASISFGTSITDGGELDLLTGLIKVNSTPPSIIQIDPVAIRTLKGINNIWSNVGDMSVTYRETLKHYLEKQN